MANDWYGRRATNCRPLKGRWLALETPAPTRLQPMSFWHRLIVAMLVGVLAGYAIAAVVIALSS